MKGEGVNNNLQFILTETAPILEISKGGVEESDKKLMEGTVIEGQLATRIVSNGKRKVPYRFIKLGKKKGFLSPHVVNLYVGHFANLDGLNPTKDDTPVRDSAFGEKKAKSKTKKLTKFVINYGLPIGGAYAGFKIAKKMGADPKKTAGYVIFFTLLGLLPRYLNKNK